MNPDVMAMPLCCVVCLYEGNDYEGKGTRDSEGWSVCPDHVGSPITREVQWKVRGASTAAYRMCLTNLFPDPPGMQVSRYVLVGDGWVEASTP